MTPNLNSLPLEARILGALEEPLAAGLYEQRNASMMQRWGRALKRYAESLAALPAATASLYPAGPLQMWNLNGAATALNYSNSLDVNGQLLRDKIAQRLRAGREQNIAHDLVGDLENMSRNPLAVRYCVGGNGYTHSILDYQRIVSDGLPEYGRRIDRGLAAAVDPGTRDFFAATQEAWAAVMLLLTKAAGACHAGTLRAALAAQAQRPPGTFYEALVLINFMFYIDGCDSIGALDRYLAPFYLRDLAASAITPAAAAELLAAFFTNCDANSGWHMILGGEGVAEEFTILCLRALNTRRPNSGLKITPATSAAVWEAAFDCLQRGSGNPAFYNDRVYREGAVAFAQIATADLPRIAFGGCTEFMIEGQSNIGSIDAGLNLLRILEGTIQAELDAVATYEQFLDCFKRDIKQQIEIMAAQLDLNQEYKAVYRPQLIRTLFIADCLDRALEYNHGGARYNGGVINVAGIANAANSLLAIQALFSGVLGINRAHLRAALANDFRGFAELRRQLLGLPKFGNNAPAVDVIAKEVVDFTFTEINRHRCRRAHGFLIPATILFVTYTGQGCDIDATPDGRQAGSAIADSCGPMQGTDIDGPTSMLTSTAQLPQQQGLGTMILNLRVHAGMLTVPALRQKLQSLLLSYFEMGGMQVQLTVLDAAQLQDALQHPELHENLIVRIGGYTEYFNRLDDQLKSEVLKRTEYL